MAHVGNFQNGHLTVVTSVLSEPPCTFRQLSNMVVATLACLLANTSGAQSQTSDELTKRFLAEAPLAWKEYEAFAQNLQGIVVFENTRDGKLPNKGRVEFKNNLTCRIYLLQMLSQQDSKGQLHGYNNKYNFSLIRTEDNRSWALKDFRLFGGNKPEMQKWRLEDLQPLQSLIVAYSAPLLQLIRQPTFRVKKAEPHDNNGQIVEIEFDNSHPVTNEASCMLIQGGRLLLDPSHFWTLREFMVRHKYQNGETTVRGVNETITPIGKFPIPKRCVSTTEFTNRETGKHSVLTVINDFDLREATTLPPDSEFFLSTFGLPEPIGVAARTSPTRWYLWISLMGVAAIMIAVILRKKWNGRGARAVVANN